LALKAGERVRGSRLDADVFAALLARIDPDPERAGQRYVEIRARLVRLLQWRGCANPEDVVDETMDRVARRLDEGAEIHARDPYSYFAGVARFVLREAIKRQQREQEGLRALSASAPWSPAPDEGRMACMARCLEALPPAARELLSRYYEGRGRSRIAARGRIASDLGIGIQILRLRLHRMREGLKACLDNCLLKGQADGNESPGAPYQVEES
jgi:DNA-directed RNA polymerase specialized sigma24 family protein